MRLLLDTHAFLWWLAGNRRLSRTARSAIGDDANDVAVSAASAWEIVTKLVSKSGITDSIIGLFRTWARQPRGRHPALPQAFGRDGSRWKGSGQTDPDTPLLLTAKRRLPAHGRPRHRPGSFGRR